MDLKEISLLGSTGSVGESTLDVVRASGGKVKVLALAAGSNRSRLVEQAREFRPKMVSIADTAETASLRKELAGLGTEVRGGPEGIIEAALFPGSSLVVSAIVGAAGILPTYHALLEGKDVALANKESLVAAGAPIMAARQKGGGIILPVDSEHSALFQTINGREGEEIHSVTLTASGGPFWSGKERDLWEVTPAEALRHPSWSMGAKVTIDSATLMNKGLEVIEACWLFDIGLDRVRVIIHPQSIVHSLVEYRDGTMLAHLSRPDMRLPIAAALYHPRRRELPWPRLDLAEVGQLAFHPPDDSRFPSLGLARRAFRTGGTAPARLNAANEMAVESFLNGRIRFPEIAAVTEKVLETETPSAAAVTIEEVLAADRSAREESVGIIEELSSSRRTSR